jgi:hypothetical protein
MTSKNKQDYEIEMHFDPQVIRMKDINVPNNRSFYILRDSTAEFGDRITCEFIERKSFKDIEKHEQELRQFADKLDYYNFEPITVIIKTQGKLYAGTLACADNSMNKAKGKKC